MACLPTRIIRYNNSSCVTTEGARDFIILAFESASGCANEINAESVDFFIEMAQAEFVDPYLVFLRAYQTACHSVMSCYAYQYDVTERYGEANTQARGQAAGNGFRQVQGTSATILRDTQGATVRYNDYSRARMDASASRTGCSNSDSYSSLTMDDSGAGAKVSRARRRAILKAHHDAQDHKGVENDSVDIGRSEGHDFTHSYDATAEDHTYGFIISATEIGKHGHSTRQMSNSSVSNGETANTNQDWSIANTREISLDGVRRDSCGSFIANITSTQQGNNSSSSANTFVASREQRQRAEGEGYQRASQDATDESRAQNKSLMREESEQTKTAKSWKFSTISSYKNSQKYETLKMLYDSLEEQIQQAMAHVGVGYAPIASGGISQPFLRSGNNEQQDVTISLLLARFPFLCCF